MEIGTIAPSFVLPNQDGKDVSLADHRGEWVVLYFYPRDDTPGCTVEACDFTDHLADFKQINATILGCSPDSPESHQRFIQKRGLKINLLSDEDKRVMGQYGAIGEKGLYGKLTRGVIRTTVLIDPEGAVAYYWPKVKAKGHVEEVKKKLHELAG